LLETVAAAETVPATAKEMLAFLGIQVAQLDEQIAELELRMKQQHKGLCCKPRGGVEGHVRADGQA
jgi:acyl-coenzyme A thioesterase PaaI-like protein